MSNQYPQPKSSQYENRPVAVVNMPQTAWKSAPAAVRFAVWVWAISVIASLAGVAILVVLFAVGLNLAILGGSR